MVTFNPRSTFQGAGKNFTSSSLPQVAISCGWEVTAMRLRVLGSSGGYPAPGRPSSGFFLEHGEAKLWIDAGNGTFAELQRAVDVTRVDALLLSHIHADHCADVYPLHVAIRYGLEGSFKLPLYAPPGSAERLGGLLNPGGAPKPSTSTRSTPETRSRSPASASPSCAPRIRSTAWRSAPRPPPGPSPTRPTPGRRRTSPASPRGATSSSARRPIRRPGWERRST
jgi:hypothetical protein